MINLYRTISYDNMSRTKIFITCVYQNVLKETFQCTEKKSLIKLNKFQRRKPPVDQHSFVFLPDRI